MNEQQLYFAVAIALIVIGLSGALMRDNIFKMVLGFGVADTGVNIFLVALGYVPGGTAPIIDDKAMFADAASLTVKAGTIMDPVPQALVLTAIVIGLGVTALMLAYVIRLHARSNSLKVSAMRSLKW